MAILLEMTLTGGVLILIVLLLRAILLNRLPKTAFIVMWAVVLVRLLLPVSFFGTTTETVAEASEVSTVEAITPTEGSEVRKVITLDSYNSASQSATIAETAERANIFRIVWLAGAVICAIVLAVSYILSIRRFNKSENLESDFIESFQSSNKLRRTVTVKLSDKTTTPLTYGIIHPVILLPNGMDLSDQKQLKYVLMHEYIHIRKLDNLLKGISSAAVCIHWFNPLVWVMNRFLSRDIELRCDEALLRQCQGDCRADYALTLIDLEDKRRGFATAGTAFAMRASEERIRAIMKYRKITPASALTMALCITLLCTAFVGCGAVGTENQEIIVTEDTATDIEEVVAETTTETTAETTAEATANADTPVDQMYISNIIDIESTDTLPDGMYISEGIVYKADGTGVGSLLDANLSNYDDMVIDGTGEAAKGYSFMAFEFEITNCLSQEQDEDSVEEADEEYITSNYSLADSYYPIFSGSLATTVYESESVDSDSDAEANSDGTVEAYSSDSEDGTTYRISLIYLIEKGDKNTGFRVPDTVYVEGVGNIEIASEMEIRLSKD